MLLARCNRHTPNFAADKAAPRTTKELDEIRESNAVRSEEESKLQKWAELFEGDGLNFPDVYNAVPKRVTAPIVPQQPLTSVLDEIPEPPNTRTRVKGRPILLETAQSLRKILFGCGTYSFTQDWRTFRFQFRDARSSIPYGLQADSPGVRALCLCVQAYVLKQLLFAEAEDEERQFGRAPPSPNGMEQEAALIDAIADILWKVSPPLVRNGTVVEGKRRAVVALPCEAPCFKTMGFFLADGITETLWLYVIHSRDELRTFIKRNINFYCGRNRPGGILLVYSIVLSHTVEVILSDMAGCQDSLLTDNARPTQAFVNLLLTGNASCYIHNGVICYDRHGRLLETPKPGPRVRSEIGFLYFDKTETNEKRMIVGCMLRTPHLPIWVTQVNGSYGLLFCTSRDLVADWKTERFFTINYYNGHFSQTDGAGIVIDTRKRAVMDPDREISIWDDEEEKERKQPSLERLLATKWPEATLDWNGEIPFY